MDPQALFLTPYIFAVISLWSNISHDLQHDFQRRCSPVLRCSSELPVAPPPMGTWCVEGLGRIFIGLEFSSQISMQTGKYKQRKKHPIELCVLKSG